MALSNLIIAFLTFIAIYLCFSFALSEPPGLSSNEVSQTEMCTTGNCVTYGKWINRLMVVTVACTPFVMYKDDMMAFAVWYMTYKF